MIKPCENCAYRETDAMHQEDLLLMCDKCINSKSVKRSCIGWIDPRNLSIEELVKLESVEIAGRVMDTYFGRDIDPTRDEEDVLP